jgi:hypothetical protein
MTWIMVGLVVAVLILAVPAHRGYHALKHRRSLAHIAQLEQQLGLSLDGPSAKVANYALSLGQPQPMYMNGSARTRRESRRRQAEVQHIVDEMYRHVQRGEPTDAA